MTATTQLNEALADRYRIERQLGSGGMATVYLALDLKHGRSVAVKVLHPDLAAALGGDRFLAEIKTTAALQHPHILPLHDSGDADGFLYYVMPFVDGESLRDRLTRERQLPIDDALRIAREVADALGYAHERGVIHRDIKPENILLQGGHALVADFGIALAVQQAGGSRMTQTGLSLGTPQYMSPEQAMGEKTIDKRSDLYALGAVTYEMLAGEPPFSGPTVQAIVAKVLTDTARPLNELRKSVPDHVSDAVAHALEKLPADRIGSASAFVGRARWRRGQRASDDAQARAACERVGARSPTRDGRRRVCRRRDNRLGNVGAPWRTNTGARDGRALHHSRAHVRHRVGQLDCRIARRVEDRLRRARPGAASRLPGDSSARRRDDHRDAGHRGCGGAVLFAGWRIDRVRQRQPADAHRPIGRCAQDDRRSREGDG